MTTTLPEITSTVTEIARAALGRPGAELAPDTDLRAVEGMDSVKVLRMIARIEQTYDIELEDEDVFGVATIAGAAALVERSLREKA
jgi:acyl carrier protein